MGSREMSVLLEGEARGYSKVKEVGCRKVTSRPWKRLPRASLPWLVVQLKPRFLASRPQSNPLRCKMSAESVAGKVSSAGSMRRLSKWKSQGNGEARGWKECRAGLVPCLLATGKTRGGVLRYMDVRWLRRDG